MKRLLPKNAFFWYSCFVIWFAVLWMLSSNSDPPSGPKIPYMDKIVHFGYFFGGSGLLSAALFLSLPKPIKWSLLFTICMLILAGTGALDEWHQSWIPERHGNDIGDWIADVSGSLTGIFVFKRLSFLFSPCSHKS